MREDYKCPASRKICFHQVVMSEIAHTCEQCHTEQTYFAMTNEGVQSDIIGKKNTKTLKDHESGDS